MAMVQKKVVSSIVAKLRRAIFPSRNQSWTVQDNFISFVWLKLWFFSFRVELAKKRDPYVRRLYDVCFVILFDSSAWETRCNDDEPSQPKKSLISARNRAAQRDGKIKTKNNFFVRKFLKIATKEKEIHKWCLRRRTLGRVAAHGIHQQFVLFLVVASFVMWYPLGIILHIPTINAPCAPPFTMSCVNLNESRAVRWLMAVEGMWPIGKKN